MKNPVTGLVKIAKAVEPETVVKMIEDGAGERFELLIAVDGDRVQELHERFTDLRQPFADWFEDDGSIQVWLQENAPQEWAQ